MRRFLIVSLLTALLPSGSLPAAEPGHDAERGKRLFKTFGCSECHGTVGQGGAGARLAPNTLPAEAIAAYIRNPAGEMPPYNARIVTDADVADIQSYLSRVAPPPAVATLDQLKWK